MPKRVAKQVKRRRVKFGGRVWTVEICYDGGNAPNLQRSNLGELNVDEGIISARLVNEEAAVATILHELLHWALPSAPEREIKRAEWQMKDALEAFGVDLSPFLKGYK